jgi:hypothetical protein
MNLSSLHFQQRMLNSRQAGHCSSLKLALPGLAALFIGVLGYLLYRPPGQVYFLHALPVSLPAQPLFSGVWFQWTPAFLHVYAFSLLSMAMSQTLQPARICLAWLVVDCLFELAQLPAVSPTVVKVLPNWFSQLPLLDNARAYLIHGVFDGGDLVAALLGACLAWLTATVLLAQRRVA